jgi:hypothetical protein
MAAPLPASGFLGAFADAMDALVGGRSPRARKEPICKRVPRYMRKRVGGRFRSIPNHAYVALAARSGGLCAEPTRGPFVVVIRYE